MASLRRLSDRGPRGAWLAAGHPIQASTAGKPAHDAALQAGTRSATGGWEAAGEGSGPERIPPHHALCRLFTTYTPASTSAPPIDRKSTRLNSSHSQIS